MDTPQMAVHAGSCMCGRIKFEASGAPDLVAICHCAACRKHTGAPMAVYADYALHQVLFDDVAPDLYESSPEIHRGYCAACGSTLSHQSEKQPHMIHLHTGAFDDPSVFAPADEESLEAQLDWMPCVLAPK